MAGQAVKVRLVSSANTGHFYTTTRPKAAAKLTGIKKYDPVVRQHVEYKETTKFK